MANLKYNAFRQRCLSGQFNWLTADVRTMLVGGAYTPSATHQFVSAIPAVAIVIRGELITNKAATDGWARGSPPNYRDLSIPQQVTGIVFYEDTGNDATSGLIAYCDDEIAFPFIPVGFDYGFTYPIGEGFFRL